MKRVLILFCSIVFSACAILPLRTVNGADAKPTVYSNKAITIVAETGEVIYSKNGTIRDFPASTTKVLTGLLLIEKLKPTDTITMSKKSLQEEINNNQIVFKEGERITRDEAIKILMVNSNNNLAYAIGERISGSISKFAALMNTRARELGAKNSTFVNASGLPNAQHQTTAYDLAMITREAIKHPLLVKAMSTTKTYVQTSRQRVLLTKDSPVYNKPYFMAAKTGYTGASKHTLVQVSKKNNITLIHVVLRSSKDKYVKDMKLLDAYGFGKVKMVKVVDQNSWKPKLSVLDQQVEAKLKQDIYIPTALPPSQFKTKMVQNPPNNNDLLRNGIFPLQKLGQVEIYYANRKVKESAVVSSKRYSFDDTAVAVALKVLHNVQLNEGLTLTHF
ncbi:D-alanyl-D-alanine carboxypeptidase family protein [Paenibacillus montanisoli]|uniref:Peptidase S11 D-alanyl-D-alanine carboxypeptidase A N-terminal domain-containing protein n=1 Tax=Paenibacillus montanisoli TaxID=2081970 RepID=A0A328TWZ8_9BACL|nr:D-alanyl-D-alanine carboxypeptidase [Paenibacillus montanisoli]RAP74212.1 hypothetical protein DL346_24445 [Paenibacillus montanisoli]